LMRQMISRILTEAGMEVVGTARDGIEALEKAAELNPDVMTLDVEMPRMDGLTALRMLMSQRPMPVVMLSSLTQQQAPAAVEALSLGAVDVVGKPGGTISLNLRDVADEIVRKVQAAAAAKVAAAPRAAGDPGGGGAAAGSVQPGAAPPRERAAAGGGGKLDGRAKGVDAAFHGAAQGFSIAGGRGAAHARRIHASPGGPSQPDLRSEEHTSELQSRENLVCRLLLEKKKIIIFESV